MTLSTISNALTFDVEEYFQVEAFKHLIEPWDWPQRESRVVASTHRLLDILEATQVRATFFVLGWVAERHPALVREIHHRHHEVACHGYAHCTISSMDREAFRHDVQRAKMAIEDAIGSPITGYRAPTWSVVTQTLWALGILVEEGFLYDASIFPIHHDRYGIPDACRFPHRIEVAPGVAIVEFPTSTLRVAGQNLPFSGGGYFRLLPYALVRAALGHLNGREGQPAIVYLHPWELDPEQPRLAVDLLTRFRHYVNLGRTQARLERLLRDFSFAPARTILQQHGFVEVAA